MLVDGELRSVIETLPEGLLLFDDQRGFYEANRAARDLRLEETIPQLEETASRALIAHGSQEQSFRLGAAARMPIRGTVLRLSGRRAAMLLRRETVRQAELHQLFMTRFGLRASEARIALRVYRGMSNAEIAKAFKVKVGTIRVRITRLYQRLGVKRRAQLIVLLDSAARQLPVPERETASKKSPSRSDESIAAASVVDLRLFLDQTAIPLAVVDLGSGAFWTNPAACELLSVHADAVCTQVEQAAASLQDEASIRIDLGSLVIRCRLWRASGSLIGVQLHREQPRVEEVECALARFGLSTRQAEVAAMIAAGRSNAEIAERLGAAEGYVRALSSTIYEMLDVRCRAELAALGTELLAEGQ